MWSLGQRLPMELEIEAFPSKIVLRWYHLNQRLGWSPRWLTCDCIFLIPDLWFNAPTEIFYALKIPNLTLSLCLSNVLPWKHSFTYPWISPPVTIRCPYSHSRGWVCHNLSMYNSPIIISAQKIPVTIAFWGSKSGYGNVTAHSTSPNSLASCYQLPFTNSYFTEKL